jgi:hypothetical protein
MNAAPLALNTFAKRLSNKIQDSAFAAANAATPQARKKICNRPRLPSVISYETSAWSAPQINKTKYET